MRIGVRLYRHKQNIDDSLGSQNDSMFDLKLNVGYSDLDCNGPVIFARSGILKTWCRFLTSNKKKVTVTYMYIHGPVTLPES